MTDPVSPSLVPRALTAEAAGVYLAQRLGLPKPLTKQRMWFLMRTGQLDSVRIGRNVVTRTDYIDEFIANGGTPRRDA